ncbi:unnamed protein product [Mytilus edulis]|uniref:Uncharacterized protein n=1 Tax=Mytilus edulis TaxID=6550 RepID=A0A8S3V0Y3_MYTED|nr:unnamed protein product [Mytilus edulis]
MRRVYQAGIEDKHWSLISSLHQNAASTIKWGGIISECFPVSLGVRPSRWNTQHRPIQTPCATLRNGTITTQNSHATSTRKIQKRFLKQLLSLPTSTPDSAVYILSGILPVEAQIDKRALGLFNNICNQDESSTEKQLARRQISVKSLDSNNWFIQIKKILTKYNMDKINTYLDIPMKK